MAATVYTKMLQFCTAVTTVNARCTLPGSSSTAPSICLANPMVPSAIWIYSSCPRPFPPVSICSQPSQICQVISQQPSTPRTARKM